MFQGSVGIFLEERIVSLSQQFFEGRDSLVFCRGEMFLSSKMLHSRNLALEEGIEPDIDEKKTEDGLFISGTGTY